MQKSILTIPEHSDFPLENVPFGVFHLETETPAQARCATIIGTNVIDLAAMEAQGCFNGPLMSQTSKIFCAAGLNSFMELPRTHWREVRSTVQKLFAEGSDFIAATVTHPEATCKMLLPCRIGDYTDFYSSKNHAYNVGCIMRGPENALQANWTWIPVGYHGRSSSVVISGTDIHRPYGQTIGPDDKEPQLTTSKRCDFELEMGVFYGGPSNGLGNRIDIGKAEENLFGMVLLNDWSARDVQKWEYVPLGPFTAKNQGTVISPWIVTMDALEPFRCKIDPQEPKPLAYLDDPKYGSYDVNLTVELKVPNGDGPEKIVDSNLKYMYWSMPQQLTHHAVTGCNMVAGDLLGSGKFI